MINILEERWVTISIDADYFNVCDRIHWVMRRWGENNFRLGAKTPWERDAMKFQFWVILHPRDADLAIEEIWLAAQGLLNPGQLPSIPPHIPVVNRPMIGH
jgi:hypothetical protein